MCFITASSSKVTTIARCSKNASHASARSRQRSRPRRRSSPERAPSRQCLGPSLGGMPPLSIVCVAQLLSRPRRRCTPAPIRRAGVAIAAHQTARLPFLAALRPAVKPFPPPLYCFAPTLALHLGRMVWRCAPAVHVALDGGRLLLTRWAAAVDSTGTRHQLHIIGGARRLIVWVRALVDGAGLVFSRWGASKRPPPLGIL